MAFLNKKNIKNISLQSKPYSFNGDLKKLNTGDLGIRKNGLSVSIRNGELTDFNCFNRPQIVPYDDFWLYLEDSPNSPIFGYLGFDSYTNSIEYKIEKIYPKAFSIEELKKIAKMEKYDAIRYIYEKYEKIK